MRVHTKTIISIKTGEVLQDDFYEYNGPVVACKSGSTTINSEDEEYNARMATIAEAQQAMAEEYYQFYKESYQPYEKEQIAANRRLIPLEAQLQETALGVGAQGLNPNTAMDMAQADVAQSFAGAQGTVNRNLGRRGVDVTSGQSVQMQKDLALERAKAIGGARTRARQNVRNRALIIGGAGAQ